MTAQLIDGNALWLRHHVAARHEPMPQRQSLHFGGN